MGRSFKRKILRLYVRMVREKKPPAFVARGWAIGMFIGCAVPFGFQLIVSIPLAFVLKGSKIGATVGTLVTNPLTIFFIYPAQTCLADRLFLAGNLSYAHLKGLEWTFANVAALGTETLTAFFLGGLMLALVLTPLTYGAIHALVTRYQRRTGKGRLA